MIFGVQVYGVTENDPRFLPFGISKRITYDILITFGGWVLLPFVPAAVGGEFLDDSSPNQGPSIVSKNRLEKVLFIFFGGFVSSVSPRWACFW